MCDMSECRPMFALKRHVWIGMSSFSRGTFELFGRRIPVTSAGFFKAVAHVAVLAVAVAFLLAWACRARPHVNTKSYVVVPFDVFGKKSFLEGVRAEFRTHDVAWSFMKQYKESYPLHNFALVSKEAKDGKQTIFKYI